MPISNPVHSSPTLGARVRHSLNQSIADNTNTALGFNSERSDTDAVHDNTLNNSRLSCKTAGTYLIGGSFAFAASPTGIRQISILLNGTTTIAAQRVPASSVDTMLSISTVYALAVNDYVQLFAYQNSGGALSVNAAASYSPEFYLHKL